MLFSARSRRLALAFGLALLIATPAAAQTYDGDWAGVLTSGAQKLRLELHVKTEGGSTTAVLDSLDQGASLPASAVKIEGGEISALFLQAGGELKGKLSPDGKTIDGSWTQGTTLPLTLTRKPGAATH